jgi:hypothetical protein
MKLNPLQWLWLVGGGVLAVILLLDVANVVEVPNALLIVLPILLLLASLIAGPSLKQLSGRKGRG